MEGYSNCNYICKSTTVDFPANNAALHLQLHGVKQQNYFPSLIQIWTLCWRLTNLLSITVIGFYRRDLWSACFHSMATSAIQWSKSHNIITVQYKIFIPDSLPAIHMAHLIGNPTVFSDPSLVPYSPQTNPHSSLYLQLANRHCQTKKKNDKS